MEATGKFSGFVVTCWMGEERKMLLETTLTYTDRAGKVWTAPGGSIVDGASIPRFFWRFIGGPFTGRYRRASVIHDVYCVTRTEPWQAVHRVFNEMMEADGVPWLKRKLMFLAVWNFGPRWCEPHYKGGD